MVGYILSRRASTSRHPARPVFQGYPLTRLRELSFAMGRPSCLGADEYHNIDFPLTEYSRLCDPNSPLLEPPHCAILEHMVHFSRLTRQVCIKLYLPQNSAARAVELAHQLDESLDAWLLALPEGIRPKHRSEQAPRLSSNKETIWMKRQKLVLTIRKCHLSQQN